MILAVALAAVAVAPPASDPGRGARLWTELGVGRYAASYEANRGDDIGKTGIDGIALGIRASLGFAARPGFIVGPTLGFAYASTGTSGGICCGTIKSLSSGRLGIEASWYPNPRVGFRVSGGFGVAVATLRPDTEARTLFGLGLYGAYYTVAIARDWAVGPRSRIGGVLRLESDALTGGSDDHRYHLRSLTPSLSIVLLSNFAG